MYFVFVLAEMIHGFCSTPDIIQGGQKEKVLNPPWELSLHFTEKMVCLYGLITH